MKVVFIWSVIWRPGSPPSVVGKVSCWTVSLMLRIDSYLLTMLFLLLPCNPTRISLKSYHFIPLLHILQWFSTLFRVKFFPILKALLDQASTFLSGLLTSYLVCFVTPHPAPFCSSRAPTTPILRCPLCFSLPEKICLKVFPCQLFPVLYVLAPMASQRRAFCDPLSPLLLKAPLLLPTRLTL